MKFFPLLFAGLLLSQAALAEPIQNNDELEAMTQDLANCAGVYAAMGEVLHSMKKQNAAQTYEDTARGAKFAAAYLSYMAEIIPKWENAVQWAENQQQTKKAYWLGLMELYTPTQEAPFPEDYVKGLDYCVALSPVQTKLVEQMRKALYSQ